MLRRQVVNSLPRILLAEDDENDQFFVKCAIRKHDIQIDLHIVDRGDSVIAYLLGQAEFGDRKKYPIPSLILLDIKLPGKSGLEVLHWIRHDSPCPNVPVIVMSSSQLKEDWDRAYSLGVNAFLTKPSAFDEVASLFKSATDLFIHRAVRPSLNQL